MTPEEFAEQTGLSLEEAEMVLARRAIKQSELPRPASRLQKAYEVLMKAQKKTGVKTYGGEK